MAETELQSEQSGDATVLANDLRQEWQELSGSANEIFGRFVDWWKFVVTANLAALAGFKGLNILPDIYPAAAIVIAILDCLGVGFCFLTCCSIAQIFYRYEEITLKLYPDVARYDPELTRPADVKSMWKLVRRCLANEPLRRKHHPNSPMPIRYYLICVSSVAPLCPLIAGLWIAGMFGNVQ